MSLRPVRRQKSVTEEKSVTSDLGGTKLIDICVEYGMSPFLSVIIPAHNEEKSICRTIRSLLRQDYRSFEIVIVVDGSTDNTIEKLTEAFGFSIMDHEKLPTSLQHAEVLQILNVTYRDIPIYLMKKENGGKGDTLNAGIDFCRGVFLSV